MASTKNFWRVGLGLAVAGAVLGGVGVPSSGSSRAQGQPAAPAIACPTGPGAGKEPSMEVASPTGEAPRVLPPLDAARPDRTEAAVFALG